MKKAKESLVPVWSKRRRESLIVGAVTGTGSSAQAVDRGGADFLVVMNSARFRMMGVPSSVGILPLRDNNEFVMSFACEEIIPRVALPVFFGATIFDPRLRLDELVDRVKISGFSGIANARGSSRYAGGIHAALDSLNLGVQHECRLFKLAKSAGLARLAYVRSFEEAKAFAEIGADIFCIQLGSNAGRMGEAPPGRASEDAIGLAISLIAAIRRNKSGAVCLLAGLPVVTPAELLEICDLAKADGYIGGSTIDRLPPETSIENKTAEFKDQRASRRVLDKSSRRAVTYASAFGGVPKSANMLKLLELINWQVDRNAPVLISGEAGTGRMKLAKCLHLFSHRKSGPLEVLTCQRPEGDRLDVQLFGSVPNAVQGIANRRVGWFDSLNQATVILDELEFMDHPTQRELVKVLETGRFAPIGEVKTKPVEVRLVFISQESSSTLRRKGLLIEGLYLKLKSNELNIPPLRDRPEDIASIAENSLAELSQSKGFKVKGLEHSAILALQKYSWPGNIRELTSILEQAIPVVSAGRLNAKVIEDVLATRDRALARQSSKSERAWILDALRRNRYRRGETAEFLGISRKTLYNKMRKLSISETRT